MNSQKALRATTIIPDELYVDREADRQLDGVVDEMGRPGYVLVARQMGKTNLLLRMKRKREALGDLALYMDLSTHFETARDLFRAIVDNLIDGLEDEAIREKVHADRQGVTLDANAEYDRHLRLFLSADKHPRVIIVLDEIDSLVGHAYSDRILSQIRSMYFARANYPVFSKLTYVLSGVAEPTDLIKDKNISPFNIGEKIYLNDFSPEEVKLLLDKAKLNIPSAVVRRVYAWVCGNPRMTWDVLSAIEDELRAGVTINPTLVDALIDKLYLTRFDRAPIDHIRALAASDRLVRDSLISLLYGKGATLDDRARSKLYLAGITTASANDAPAIKNKVIESALSEVWLSQVEAGKQGLLTAASKRYLEANYQEAIDLFYQYIEAEGNEDTLSDLNLMEFGLAHYRLSQLAQASRILEAALAKSRSSELRNILRFHLATTQILAGAPSEAIGLLEEVAKVPGAYQLQAKLQIGTAFTAISAKEHADEIVRISEEVLHGAESDQDLSHEDAAELRVACLYNLALAYGATDRAEEAQASLDQARRAALPGQLPGLSSVLLVRKMSDEDRRETFVAAAKIVISERLPYSTSPASFAFKSGDMAVLLGAALELGEYELYEGLVEVAVSNDTSDRIPALVALATSDLIKSSQSATVGTLLRHINLTEIAAGSLSPKVRLQATRAWLMHADPNQREQAFKLYFEVLLTGEVDDFIDLEDPVFLINRVGELSNEGRDEEMLAIIGYARARSHLIASKSRALFAFIIFNEMLALNRASKFDAARTVGYEVLDLISPSNLMKDAASKVLSSSIDQLREVTHGFMARLPNQRSHPKIGRNVIVVVRDRETGALSEQKFKKVSQRIARGELELIGTKESAP